MFPLRLAVVAGLFVSLAGVAAAQSPVTPQSAGLGTPTGPVVGGGLQGPTKKEPPPPALPGARIEKSEAAPAQKPPMDMAPNEALFDGVNRGDVGAVRDALNRGADLSARNVLGLSPTELSVDLGRNDITFLLLSQRGAPTGGDEAVPASGSGSKKVGANDRSTPSGKSGARSRQAATTSRREPRPSQPREAATPPLQRAQQRQYAGDGGTPIPQVGFLGFGGPTR